MLVFETGLCNTPSALSQPGDSSDTQARSSVGERHLDVVDVGGSIPPAPTKIKG